MESMNFRTGSILRHENYESSGALTVNITGYYPDKCDISFLSLVPSFNPKNETSIESIRIRYRSQLNRLNFDMVMRNLLQCAGRIDTIVFCTWETRVGKVYKDELAGWFDRNGHELTEFIQIAEVKETSIF